MLTKEQREALRSGCESAMRDRRAVEAGASVPELSLSVIDGKAIVTATPAMMLHLLDALDAASHTNARLAYIVAKHEIPTEDCEDHIVAIRRHIAAQGEMQHRSAPWQALRLAMETLESDCGPQTIARSVAALVGSVCLCGADEEPFGSRLPHKTWCPAVATEEPAGA